MACPTCDHTMSNIGFSTSDMVHWCPRCGTVKIGELFSKTPGLVRYVKGFVKDLYKLDEMVNLPEGRAS